MKPTQVVQSLRHIAASIQASKNPDRRLIARDLKKIVSILLNKNNIKLNKNNIKSFKGTIRSGYDGENCDTNGKIIINSGYSDVEHQVTTSASGNYTECILNGEDISNTSLADEINEFFSRNWLDEEDPAWSSGFKTAEVQFN